jgi:hypothetical protein
MKRWLIVLLVLAAAGGLCAQELKWDGGVFFGLGLSSDETKAPTIYDENWWIGDNDWGGGTWSKAAGQVAATYSQENVRATLRLRGRFSNTNTYDLTVPLAKIEFDLLDKKIGVRAGRLDEYLWSTTTYNWWQVTGGVGALVEVKPLDGLSFGAILKTDGVDDGVKNTEEFFKRAAFGVSYTKGDLLYAAGAMQLADGRDAAGDLNTAAFATYGLNIYAVPNLILNTEGKFENIGAGKDAAGEDIAITTNLVQDIGYSIIPGTFKAVLQLRETLAADTALVFKPYAEYVINSSFTAYIEISGSINKLADANLDELYIKPQVTYNIAPGASIIGYYQITVPDGKDPVHTVKFSFSQFF